MKAHILNGPEDIRRVFIEAIGMPSEEYDDGINSSAVKEMVMLQERLFYEYGVKSTPSVYVNGKYQINNSSFNSLSVEDLRDSYAITVKGLLSRGG
ncbi:DsbA family protein [Salmonella enterica]